jgi:hypothetical protein
MKTTTLKTTSDLKKELGQVMGRFARIVPTLPATPQGKLALMLAGQEFRELARGIIELGLASEGWEKSTLALVAGIERMNGELEALEAASFAFRGSPRAPGHVELGKRLVALPPAKLYELVAPEPARVDALFAELVPTFAFGVAGIDGPGLKSRLDQLKVLIQIILTILAKGGGEKFTPWLVLVARALDAINSAVRVEGSGVQSAEKDDCFVQIILMSIERTGQSVGVDWTYEFGATIDGAIQSPLVVTPADTQPRPIASKLCVGRCGEDVAIHLGFAATEADDFDPNDVGSGAGDWTFTCPAAVSQTVSVNVREDNQPNGAATTIAAEVLILLTCQQH